ncbi:MAG TPA: antibiotic biosynthesis monooxygenase [Dyella sp.]|uniref:antibiotic biosynthesis monooxygenase family protein n=1 Tax=Dyella sp. TaxID=1869338 RepID=UPI002F94BED5
MNARSVPIGEKQAERSLFVVAFEVMPAPGCMADYLHTATVLRSTLVTMEGFLANERFASRSRRDTFLSLSLWDDEKALIRWRVNGPHHAAQEAGRQRVFADYRLRVGEATQVTGPFADRSVGWMRRDITAVGSAKWLSIVDAMLPSTSPHWREVEAALSAQSGLVSREFYDHLQTSGRVAIVCGWNDERDALRFAEAPCWNGVPELQMFTVRVIRDYGMVDRHEAPQFYR